LRVSEEERDLEVIIHSIVKPPRQCAKTATKAIRILVMIKRSIVIRYQDI